MKQKEFEKRSDEWYEKYGQLLEELESLVDEFEEGMVGEAEELSPHLHNLVSLRKEIEHTKEEHLAQINWLLFELEKYYK